MNDWVPLSPAIDRSTTPNRLYRECFKQLAPLQVAGDGASQTIEAVRVAFLSKLASRRDGNERRARVVISILCDLRLQGWEFEVKGAQLSIRYPQTLHESPLLEKQRVQAGHLLERDGQLREPATRRFIVDMERQRLWKGSWVSIFSLMRDGRDLAERLASGATVAGEGGSTTAQSAIAPYLQMVDSDALCEHTGLRLMDIWRYFRHTWTTSYRSTPGRKMFVLVRDAAAPCHPVIGIAGLGSPIVQLRTRDQWVGWAPKQFFGVLAKEPSVAWAKWVLSSQVMLLKSVYVEDLIKDKLLTRADLKTPGELAIRRLRKEAKEARRLHTLHWRVGRHKVTSGTPERANWKDQAQTYLFRSKRAGTLAELLEAKLSLQRIGFKRPTAKGLEKALGDRRARAAIQSVLRSMKAVHAGVDMLDITICGAIEPYRALLGGKLVSLLMASPEIVRAYEKRYKSAVSLIASAMAGKAVRRQPRLVLLGTTSLYGVASSQYNRIRVQLKTLGLEGAGEVRFEELGRTEGFGSYHFSEVTMREMEVLLRRAQAGRRVNSIFGEGVSPKLRKVRGALDLVGMPSDVLLKHGSPRLVYGVPLASNFREVLLGRSETPHYILPKKLGKEATELLAAYWRARWLSGRIKREDVLESVASHTLVYPVRHGARVPLPVVDGELRLLTGQSAG